VDSEFGGIRNAFRKIDVPRLGDAVHSEIGERAFESAFACRWYACFYLKSFFFKLHAHSVYSCAVRFSSCVIVLVDFVDICFHRHFLPTISGSSFRFASQEDNTKTISVKEFEKALRTWNFPRATKQVPLGPMSKLHN